MRRIIKVLLVMSLLLAAVVLMAINTKPEIALAAGKLSAPKIIGTVASSKTVTVRWNSVKGAGGYKIYKYNSSKKKYQVCGAVDASAPCFYEVSGLKEGKTYKFKVAAYVEKAGKQVVQKKSKTAKAKTLSAKVNTEYEFYVYDSAGNKLNLSDYSGKPVIINLWATWCGYCLYELPDLDRFYREYGDKVKFFMINCEPDDYPYADQFAKENGYCFPVYYDLDYSADSIFYLGGIPVTAAIRGDGTLVYFKAGYLTEDRLKNIIDEVL